jgi:hypothetical protein
MEYKMHLLPQRFLYSHKTVLVRNLLPQAWSIGPSIVRVALINGLENELPRMQNRCARWARCPITGELKDESLMAHLVWFVLCSPSTPPAAVLSDYTSVPAGAF